MAMLTLLADWGDSASLWRITAFVLVVIVFVMVRNRRKPRG
jgi:hypothetical protein